MAVNVDGGFSHDFTSAQVHYFLTEEYGEGYRLKNPAKFAVFEDHLIYADEVQAIRDKGTAARAAIPISVCCSMRAPGEAPKWRCCCARDPW